MARAVGRGDAWGTIEAGKAADVLVVDGDPARDVRLLRDKSRIIVMLQDGRIVTDRMTELAYDAGVSLRRRTMKMILALIEPQKLKYVRRSLSDIGIYNLTVSTALGCSTNSAPIKERYRGIEQEMYLFRKTRLEIVVNDDQVDSVIDAIAAAARMEIERNHGIIFVYDILQAVKVTGERGPEIVQVRGR